MKKHLSHYLSLVAVFIAAVAGIYIFSYDRGLQMVAVVAAAVAYVIWGIVHHFLHKDLYLSVVIEYVVVALVGIVLVFSLIFRV